MDGSTEGDRPDDQDLPPASPTDREQVTKTTIEFPTQLLALAKVDAAKGGLSLRQWMTAVVASALEAEQRAGPRDWVTLTDLAAEQNPFVAQVLAVLET